MFTHLTNSRSSMLWHLGILAIAIAGTAPLWGAQQMSAAVRSELAPTGRLRVGINFGNALLAVKDASGKPGGIAVLLAQELSRRTGLPMDIVPYESAGRMADGVKTGAWDLAFLGSDPDRAGEIDFTAPYLEIESTYLVPAGSPLRRQEDVDRAGVRIAVSAKSAYDLYLTREIKRAQLVRAPSPPESVDLFFKDKLDALAALRPVLVDLAEQHKGTRVLDGAFTVVTQAVGSPKGRPMAAQYLKTFVEDAKKSGLITKVIATSGVRGVSVAAAARN